MRRPTGATVWLRRQIETSMVGVAVLVVIVGAILANGAFLLIEWAAR